jgi:hypothetical protein
MPLVPTLRGIMKVLAGIYSCTYVLHVERYYLTIVLLPASILSRNSEVFHCRQSHHRPRSVRRHSLLLSNRQGLARENGRNL